jgi:hypothetical protein
VPLVRIDLAEGQPEDDRLHDGLELPPEDVVINPVEVPKENGSYGNGEAQHV